MLKPSGLEVANDLCLVFGTQSPGCFEFNYQYIVDDQIRDIVSYYGSIFVKYYDWVLLFYVETCFGQTVRQCVFINFLKVAMAMINVDLVGNLSNLIS